MSDNGKLEAAAEWFRLGREASDNWRFRAGIKLARLDKTYGLGVVEAIARDAHISRRSLYEYRQVSQFMLVFAEAVDGNSLCARRTFDTHPVLTYSHFRRAMRLEDEAAIDALLHAELELMGPDRFAFYVQELKGKPVPQVPLFDQEGTAAQVVNFLYSSFRQWAGRKVRIIVREVE